MSLRDQLRGTGVALVTPFKKDDSIDFDALQKLINHVIAEGVQYVVSLGSTGETPVLSKEEQKEIFLFTVDKVAGRVPIVAGIAGNNTSSVIKELEIFPLEKATAVLSVSPYYNKPTQEGIFQHYKALAKASPKPVIIYNVPSRTGGNISAAVTLRLANEVENIGGTKEASANMIQCMHILRDRPKDFLITSGDDHVTLSLIACGMDGVISVAANCFAGPFVKMVQAALNNDFEQARRLHYQLLEGFDLLFAENNPAGVKAVLSELGFIENKLRLPLVPLTENVLQQVKKYLPSLQ